MIWITWRSCKYPLHLLDGPVVEEVSELLLPEELTQEVPVEGKRVRPPLRRRCVVFVHVVRHVVEEKRDRIGRGGRGLDVHEIELARTEARKQLLQRGQVEDVLEALAVGLEDDGERAVAARHLKQALRLQTLLPERRPLSGAAARDQQRAGCIFAEAGAEEGALRKLAHHELFDLVGLDYDLRRGRGRVGVR